MTGSLTHNEIITFLLQIALMLSFGKIMGETAKKLKQPGVVGEIIAGIILGPTVLGSFSPELFYAIFPPETSTKIALHGLTTLSVILLLFISGLEVELDIVANQRKKAFFTSFFGLALSFSFGFFIAYFLPNIFVNTRSDTLIFALFIGTALSITALPVIVRTLMDLGIFKSHLGLLIVSSAMLDDFVGWMIFSVILGMINEGHNTSLFITALITVLFAAGVLTLGRRILDRVLPFMNEHLSFPGGILAFAISLCLIGAAFTEYIGIHAIFGSFIVGIAIGDSIHMSRKTKELAHDFVTNIFAPLFFVSIGLKVNFIKNFDPVLVLVIMFFAFLGKILGCGLGAYTSRFSLRESLAIGFGMNARGAMEIILATLALQAGVIDKYVFVALVIMAIVTSITSGYMMKTILPKNYHQSNETSNGFVIFGYNGIGKFISKFLYEQKVPVLITDLSKPNKYNHTRSEIIAYYGNLLDKKNVEKLDLGRYSNFMALTGDDDNNEKACKIFEQEFNENSVFRLITKKESKSASLSLPQNILFRGIHWNFAAIEKILEKKPSLNISKISFDSEESLDRFISFNNHKKQIIPLLIQKGKHRFIPVSSFKLDIKKGDMLIYLDVPKEAPKSVKPDNYEKDKHKFNGEV